MTRIAMKNKLLLYFIGLVLLFGVLGALLWQYERARTAVLQVSTEREDILELVYELRQNANDLTRMARMYVSTGERAFREYHNQIRSIRDGTAPRPENYSHQYWDTIVTGGHVPNGTGTSVALVTLLTQKHLTSHERALLDTITQQSRVLEGMEQRAITLRWPGKGKTADSAHTLVYGEEYRLAKGDLMNSIASFAQMIDDRSTAQLQQGRAERHDQWKGIVFVAIVIGAYSLLGWLLFRRSVVNPLVILFNTISRHADTQSAVAALERGEIASLSTVYDDLLRQLQGTAQDLSLANKQLQDHSEELIQLNSTLEARTQLLNAMINHTTDAVITFDLEGKLLSFNPAAERLFGYQEHEVVGHNSVMTLLTRAYRTQYEGYLRHYVNTGDGTAVAGLRELQVLRRDGTEVPVEISLNEFRLGTHRQFVGIVRNISERKVMEQMKGDFVSVVSHELRTPLTSIAGSLGLLQGGGGGELSPKVQKLVTIALENSKRLVRLVNDVLDLEKVEAGKMEFHIVSASIQQIVEQSLEANQGYADAYQVHCELRTLAPDACVRADIDRLVQVFVNLLSNAIKFSKPGGVVDVSIQPGEGEVRVSVHDYGPGIPLEFQGRIFDRFSQADASNQRPQGGTGLGLSIAKGIVERHGGRISFETILGEGTVFHVDIPNCANEQNDTGRDTRNDMRAERRVRSGSTDAS